MRVRPRHRVSTSLKSESRSRHEHSSVHRRAALHDGTGPRGASTDTRKGVCPLLAGNQWFGRQTSVWHPLSGPHEAPFHKSTETSAPEGQPSRPSQCCLPNFSILKLPSRPCRVHGRNGAEGIRAGKKKSLLWGILLLRGSSTPRAPRCTRGGASGRAVDTLDAQTVQRHVEARP